MNTKKLFLVALLAAAVSVPAFAGGILTNTNQSISFMRMFARGAYISADGVYANPAGLAFLDDGFHMSFNWQSAYQTRDIGATFALFPEPNNYRKYEGTASAPIIPSLYAVYKKDKWAFSGYAGVVGGGGKASFDEGLPMFDSQVMAGVAGTFKSLIAANPALAGLAGSLNDLYGINSAMKGKQFIFGLQLGASYQVADWLSVYGGARMNYFTGGYEGHLEAMVDSSNPAVAALAQSVPTIAAMASTPLVQMGIDVSQTGWGIQPIIGANFKFGNLNLGLKYEFMCKLNIENDTKELIYRRMGSDVDITNTPLAAYSHGVNTPNDVPALLTAAAQYDILPTLRAAAEFHFFDDKRAGMANDKQKTLTRGTYEYLAGVEWDVHKIVTLSAGGQITDYGLSDQFQSDTSFSCDSYSIGFGTQLHLNDKLDLDIAYFWTNYSDYEAAPTNNYNNTTLPGQNTYSRTNKVFGAGITYRF